MRSAISGVLLLVCAATACANEVTVKNDSLTDFSNGVIVTGFAADEKAASWLTSPCAGNVVAVQIFWRSSDGNAAQTIEQAIEIFRAGTFPDPGATATTIGGPVLNDGVFNEYRWLDENNTIPLSVPVAQNEVFVVSFQFLDPPPAPDGPSVVRDTDGNPGGRNAIYASLGGGQFVWVDSLTLGVQGDWTIRAVVNCQTVATAADVSVTIGATPSLYTPNQALTYTLVVGNAGPAPSPNTTVIDVFPAAFTNASWTCAATGGGTCSATGSGNIVESNVSLPVGATVTYSANGVVAAGTQGVLSNSVTAAVGSPATDPTSANNTAVSALISSTDHIFTDGFGG